MPSKVCWEDTCTNLRDIDNCSRCARPFCPDHLDDLTNLCLHCVPVEEKEYQKWVDRNRMLKSLGNTWD